MNLQLFQLDLEEFRNHTQGEKCPYEQEDFERQIPIDPAKYQIGFTEMCSYGHADETAHFDKSRTTK